MLQALQSARFGQAAAAKTLPPPVGGWNARDALDQMAAEDAYELDNWFPRTSDVILRGGSAPHCDTTETADVEMLESITVGATSKMIAAAGGAIYDVTTATPSSLATGYGSDRWNTFRFK